MVFAEKVDTDTVGEDESSAGSDWGVGYWVDSEDVEFWGRDETVDPVECGV